MYAMSDKLVWLFIFVLAYWVYCIFCGLRASQKTNTSCDYFIAGRGISTWTFVLAATSTCFAAWAFLGHSGLVFRDGFQYVNASFYAISVPLAGVILLKRQWMLGKRYGYVTPGEMFADYFKGDAIRIISVGISLFFAVPFLGMLFGASGFFVSELSEGYISRTAAMWVLASVVLLYVVTGGFRALANVGIVQCVLFLLGPVIIGLIAFHLVGGFDSLNMGLAKIAENPITNWGSTKGLGGGDYNGYFAVPGVIQWTAGLGKEIPVGGPWTSVMCFTFMLSMMGIQSSPSFSMWGFASKSPQGFAIHQVWGLAFCVGLILFIFVTFQGVAANLLGANAQVNGAGLNIANIFPALPDNYSGSLAVYYIKAIGNNYPWLLGILAVCGLAAIQSVGASYLLTSAGMLTRDIFKRYLNPTASDEWQKKVGRVCVLLITLAALLMATFTKDAMVLLGGLAIAFGFQLLPSILAVIWFPWITRQAATLGLVAGLIAVILTEPIGQFISGGALPWGRWPLTIHSAGWGIFFNLLICIAISMLTKSDADKSRRMKFHQFLKEHTILSTKIKRLKPVAWVIVLIWMFFAIGPGVVIGNALFGEPGGGYQSWIFGMPSIWVWQLFWWALGVGVIWFLAYKMEMSTMIEKKFESLVEE